MHSMLRNLRYSHIVSLVHGSCFPLCYNRGPVCNDRNHAGCITNPSRVSSRKKNSGRHLWPLVTKSAMYIIFPSVNIQKCA